MIYAVIIFAKIFITCYKYGMSKIKSLLIVESPAKAKTIEKYLSDSATHKYRVSASVGHVRDLPKSSKDAVDIEGGFIPHYQISPGKKDVISRLTKMAADSDEVLLATDPDREGEAIAWHLSEVLKLKNPKRVSYVEITKEAIKEAIEKPRKIDMNLKYAQEARRILDRLVGYDLSGLIWKKVRYGLSAGRVQSPALRIIMEKEREIRAFIPETYWTLEAKLNKEKLTFSTLCKEEPRDREVVDDILKKAKNESWLVKDIKETTSSRKPKAPFTTSTIQQTASSRLGFSPSRTMRAAQKLYEAGYITYMRTDSTSLSQQALGQATKVIQKQYGKDYVEMRSYAKKSKNAQEAHEAIRPSNLSKLIAGKAGDEKLLYDLIWKRTITSQMRDAKIMRTTLFANISTDDIPDFKTTGMRVLDEGWLLADPDSRSEENEIPPLQVGDNLKMIEIIDTEKATQPPGRYSDAGLVRELEKRGIGRPSTYASIIQTLVDRGYVVKEGRTLIPTDTGDVVSSFLEEHFMEYINDTFTASMEDTLDEIAHGTKEYRPTMESIYSPFHAAVEAKADIDKITTLGKADSQFTCPKCHRGMDIKLGRGGKFLSCEDFPDCDGALTLEGKELGEDGATSVGKHPDSGEEILVLNGRFGPYVQLGKSPDKDDKEAPKPRRASLGKEIKEEDLTLEIAVKLLSLPRDLGPHPDDGEMVIANVGRFGPYVGHHKNYKSIKKLSPYDITLDEAVALLKEPKKPPRGAEIIRSIGEHPKTKREILLYKSKTGYFMLKGLKRIYLDDAADPQKVSIEEVVELMKQG